MLAGMPISISLGLTVFTGIERFEIMAVPVFILAGNFLTHGGVARRMIDFATSVVGHWHGGLALAGILACAMLPWLMDRASPPSSLLQPVFVRAHSSTVLVGGSRSNGAAPSLASLNSDERHPES
jgi:Na+/proline symporter